MTTPTLDQVVGRVAAVTSIAPHRLVADAELSSLVTDSLVLVEVAIDLQEEFDVILVENDLHEMRTIGDVVAVLARRAEEQAA
jgi:acyl carrier protein